MIRSFTFAFLMCASASSIAQVIPGPGFEVTPQGSVPIGYADSTLRLLLSQKEWVNEGFIWNPPAPAKSFMVDYGSRGKLITVDQLISNVPYVKLSLLIEQPRAMPLRHQIIIGTDKAKWEIVERAASKPSDPHFYRSYLLRESKDGALIGYVFYEGAMVELEWEAQSNDKTLRSFEKLTDLISRRLQANYDKVIAPIANKLKDHSLIPARPDLPDPDKRLQNVPPKVIKSKANAG